MKAMPSVQKGKLPLLVYKGLKFLRKFMSFGIYKKKWVFMYNQGRIIFRDMAFGSYNLTNISTTVENSKFGKIVFLKGVTGSGFNFSNDFQIKDNFVFVNPTISGLNKPANVTLYGIGDRGFTNPIILKDGHACHPTL